MSFEIAVVGGGVIGLSCAWKMAREGAQVLLLERGEVPGLEASWAAAGLLAAQSEIGGHSAKAENAAFGEPHRAERSVSAQPRALRRICIRVRRMVGT